MLASLFNRKDMNKFLKDLRLAIWYAKRDKLLEDARKAVEHLNLLVKNASSPTEIIKAIEQANKRVAEAEKHNEKRAA